MNFSIRQFEWREELFQPDLFQHRNENRTNYRSTSSPTEQRKTSDVIKRINRCCQFINSIKLPFCGNYRLWSASRKRFHLLATNIYSPFFYELKTQSFPLNYGLWIIKNTHVTLSCWKRRTWSVSLRKARRYFPRNAPDQCENNSVQGRNDILLQRLLPLQIVFLG